MQCQQIKLHFYSCVALCNAVTVDQVNAAAKKYLRPATGVLVIAGATPQ